jgi:hypothetical protein
MKYESLIECALFLKCVNVIFSSWWIILYPHMIDIEVHYHIINPLLQ